MGKPTTAIDWDEAFAFFASLDKTKRSYPVVSQRFSVSLTSVKKHGREERWIERAEALDKQAAEQANRKIVKSRAERIADTIAVAVEARAVYLARLQAGEAEVRGSDVAALTRMEALVEGEATDRVELAAVIEHERELLDFFIAFVAEPKRESVLEAYGKRFAHAGNGSSS